MSGVGGGKALAETRVGVIGLGNIGGGVAANLVAAAAAGGLSQVLVSDLDGDKVTVLVEAGAVAATVAEAAGCDLVFTSLPGPKQIRQVGLGSESLVANLASGAVWVELSTNDQATAADMADACVRVGAGFVDAPVSGGPEGAAAGTLSVFVGGEDDHVTRARPVIDLFASRVFTVGPVGAGLAAKIAQVTLCYTQTVAVAEALLLGAKAGVDPEEMLAIINHSAGRSYVSENYGPEILAGTYDASFPISHAAKDMRLADELARAVGAELPMIAEVAAHYARTETIHGSRAPHLLAARLVEEANGVSLGSRPGDTNL